MADTTVAPAGAKPRSSFKGFLAEAFSGNLRQYGMMFALAAIMLLFQVLTNGLFLRPRNVTSLLVQNGYILILAIGMVMVIIAGHIDLSVGSVCAFVGATVAMSMKVWHLPWPAAIVLGLVLGMLVGAWQGYWVAYVGIPAFIVTLAGMLLFRGLDLIILNAESIPVPDAFQKIANGYLPNFGPEIPTPFAPPGGLLAKATVFNIPTLILAVIAVVAIFWMEFRKRAAMKKYNMAVSSVLITVVKLAIISALILYFGALLASYQGIPVVGIILFGLIIIYSFITQRTVIGRHIYAVGGNSNAARLSGVDTRKVDFLVMTNMGLLSGVAGMVFTAYLNAANPKDGVGFELDAIAAVFIGGAAVTGGVGTVIGSMVGGLVMGSLNLGLANLSVDSNWIQIIKGFVLLAAVALDVMSKKQGKPSIIGLLEKGIRGNRPGPAAPTPVRADEVSGTTGVTHVARTHDDDIPLGATSAPIQNPTKDV